MATSTFYSPTQDEILDDYLRDLSLEIPGVQVGEGSDSRNRGTVLAQTLLPIYRNGEILNRESLPDLAISDRGLQRWSIVAATPKLGAAYADGTSTVVASMSTTVPDGSYLRRPSTGALYKTVGSTSVSTTPSTAFVVALTAGAAGNADAGTVLEFVATPPGVNPQATVVSISGGDSAWSNARWAAEIQRSLRARAGGGNVPQVLKLCACIPGVEQAFVYPALRKGGSLDVVVLTSAASGSRVAGRSLLSKVSAALRFGARAIGGDFVHGIPCDVYENTSVAPAVEQSVDLLVGMRASLVNAWARWPASSAADPQTWYTVGGSAGIGSMSVDPGLSVAGVAPVVGSQIAVFFPSVGYAKATILNVIGPSPWTVSVGPWSPTPTETAVPVGSVISPWNAMLPRLAGPMASGSNALSGAVYDFFASLGPGEATALTADDVTRRCRWPRQSDTNPITGEIEWPTDVGGRLSARVYDATDVTDVTLAAMNGTSFTPSVPAAAFIGTPPSILVLRTLVVLPP